MWVLTDSAIYSSLEISSAVVLDPSLIPVAFQNNLTATILQLALQVEADFTVTQETAEHRHQKFGDVALHTNVEDVLGVG